MNLIDESCYSNEVYPSGSNRDKRREKPFSFVVEKDKKPDLKYKLKDKCKSPEEIYKNFFHPGCSYAQGKKFEKLNYSFETGEQKFYEAGDCPFIEAYRIAYLHHFPIVINPNIFWLIILQGFSKHMEIEDNAKRNRFKFVKFEGQKDITIRTDLNFFRASDDQWQVIIEKLLKETSKYININQNILKVFKEKFSTSTREEEIAISVTFLSIFKKYFKYTIDGTCGISKITIEGTIKDWELLFKKIIEIGNLDEKIVFWTDEIKKIVQKIINTLKTRKPDINFFKNMVQNTDRSRECQPDLINGWIVKFIPYDKNNNQCNFNSPEFNGLTIEQIPSQIVILPFNLINVFQKYDAEIYTGFFGISQDEKTLAIKPIIGYIIVKVEKNEEDPKTKKIRQLEQELERLKLNQGQNSNMNENMFYPQNYNY